MAVRVRTYKASDAASVASVMFRSVREAALTDYTSEQVQAWLPSPPSPDAFAQRAADGRLILVALDEHDRVVAYGDLERTGHIDHLYCSPEFVGRGVGSAIYERLEAAARALSIETLFVEASEPAKRLFLAKGFVLIERQEFERNGVSLHNYAMQKRLSAERGTAR